MDMDGRMYQGKKIGRESEKKRNKKRGKKEREGRTEKKKINPDKIKKRKKK